MKKILRTLAGEKTSKPPIWIMRQAGRYLPEYRQIRANAKNFLDLCYNPKLASEITLQPIKRFGFDASIIFSDILVIPDALGIKVNFVKGEGPKLEKISQEEDLLRLKLGNIENHLAPIFENISLVKNGLNDKTALIGFSGSPWTISTYMIEGGGSKNFEKSRGLAISNPEFMKKLSDILVEVISEYLIKQIESGVEIVKLFDSWAGILPENEFTKWVIKPNKKIIAKVKERYPEIPVILFTKGAGILYENVAREIDCECLAIDQNVSLNWAREILQKKYGRVVQGNLDNILLANGSAEEVQSQTQKILRELGDHSFIFNLGHGILPHTPIKNVEALLKLIH